MNEYPSQADIIAAIREGGAVEMRERCVRICDEFIRGLPEEPDGEEYEAAATGHAIGYANGLLGRLKQRISEESA